MFKTVVLIFLVIAPGCNPWLWCVCLHYAVNMKLRFRTCWIGDIMFQSSTKPDSGVTSRAVISLISNDTNACSRMGTIEQGIEPFLVAIDLQGGLWTNQLLPRVTTQCGAAVLPVSDQWVQRVGLLVDDNKVDLMADLHTKTDLGEGCVPVGRQLSLLCVKPSLSSRKIVFSFVSPVPGVIMKGFLWNNLVKEDDLTFQKLFLEYESFWDLKNCWLKGLV